MVSVIIPNYNREALITRAVNSVLAQSYSEVEVIVVDDCSTDNSIEKIKTIEDERLTLIKLEKNSGACAARNRGIKAAKGEYISFLDSDDEWDKDKLKKQLDFLKKKKADIVVCNYWYEKNGKTSLHVDENHPDKFTYNELLDVNNITTGAMFVKKQLFKKVGLFDEKMPRYQDWELVLRIAKAVDIYFINEPLLTLHFQENSITSSTGMEKKYFALERMFEKNKDDIMKNRKAYAHYCWSMGLYSLYGQDKRLDLIRKSISLEPFNVKKLAIYAAIKLGMTERVKKAYGRNH